MAKDRGRKGKLFIISAPSGCGKTTLAKRLLEDDLGLAQSVSVTTRSPRAGEKEGVDYYFVSKKAFGAMIRRKELLEHEVNFGNHYGTPRKKVEEKLGKGESILLSIDVKGAMNVKGLYPNDAVLIFIMPPSISDLKKRLVLRNSDDKKTMDRRLKFAKKEVSYKNRYDHVVVNDRLETAYRRLKKIIVNELDDKTEVS